MSRLRIFNLFFIALSVNSISWAMEEKQQEAPKEQGLVNLFTKLPKDLQQKIIIAVIKTAGNLQETIGTINKLALVNKELYKLIHSEGITQAIKVVLDELLLQQKIQSQILDNKKGTLISFLQTGKSIDEVLSPFQINPSNTLVAQQFLKEVLPPLITNLKEYKADKSPQKKIKISYPEISNELQQLLTDTLTIGQALLIWYAYNYKQFHEGRLNLKGTLNNIYKSLSDEQKDLLRKLIVD